MDKAASKQAETEGRAKILLEGPILTSMATLAAPLLLIGILNSANTLIGAVWVGHLGGVAVAAVALSFPVTFFCLAIGTSFSVAGSTLIAQYFGARNQAMINQVAAQCLMMAVVVSAGLALIGLAAAPLILDLMGASDDVHHLATTYLRVALASTVFSFPMIMFQAIMRALGDTRLPLYLIIGTIVLSLGLVPLCVFGYGPIPAFGVAGAALAQLVTQAIALSVALTAVLSGRLGIHLRRQDFVLDLKLVRRIFLLGVPASAEIALRGLGVMSITVIAAQFGTLNVASYGVVNNMLQLVNVPATALSLSVAILAGQSIGAGNLERARRIGRIGLTFGFSLMTLLGLAALVFSHAFVAFFVPTDRAVIESAAHALRIICLAWGFIGLQYAVTALLRSTGNMLTPLVLTAISQFVLQFPLAWGLSHYTPLGVSGIWWAFPIANLIAAAISLTVFLGRDWTKRTLIEDPVRP